MRATYYMLGLRERHEFREKRKEKKDDALCIHELEPRLREWIMGQWGSRAGVIHRKGHTRAFMASAIHTTLPERMTQKYSVPSQRIVCRREEERTPCKVWLIRDTVLTMVTAKTMQSNAIEVERYAQSLGGCQRDIGSHDRKG